jgi:hypothetical protein
VAAPRCDSSPPRSGRIGTRGRRGGRSGGQRRDVPVADAECHDHRARGLAAVVYRAAADDSAAIAQDDLERHPLSAVLDVDRLIDHVALSRNEPI